MGRINSLAKWNLKTDSWSTVGENNRGKALSIASYQDVIHKEEDPGFHYILLADGYRVENVSSNGRDISERRSGIKKVIEYFEKKGENYRIHLLLVDNDAPLREDGKRFAKYIDRLAGNDNVKSINFVGLSKCGVIGFDMIKYIRTAKGLAKTNIYSVSAPYLGTFMASPKIIHQEAKRLIQAKIGENILTDKFVDALVGVHHKVLSNSHMDFDIALPGGVEDEYLSLYDPTFLGNIFSQENVEAAKLPNHYQNIFTQIDDGTLKRVLHSGDMVGLGLIILNDWLFDGKSDGLVGIDSQRAIEQHVESSNNIVIPSPHGVLGRPYSKDLFDVVNDTIENKPYVMKSKNR